MGRDPQASGERVERSESQRNIALLVSPVMSEVASPMGWTPFASTGCENGAEDHEALAPL